MCRLALGRTVVRHAAEAQRAACRSLICTTEVHDTCLGASRTLAVPPACVARGKAQTRMRGRLPWRLTRASKGAPITAGLDGAVFCRLSLPRSLPIIGLTGRREACAKETMLTVARAGKASDRGANNAHRVPRDFA